MTVINTNVGALTARTYALKANAAVQQSMERLSSGLRINSASDDAAGLAVANKMESQLRGLNVAIRNSHDGVSLVQTAEAGMSEITNMIIRIRELSVQMNNGVYTDSDRTNAQLEVTALLAEIDKIASNTAFNDVKVLDGTYSADIRAGNTNAESVIVDIDRMNTDSLGGVVLDKTIITTATAGDRTSTVNVQSSVVASAIEANKVEVKADQLSTEMKAFVSANAGGTYTISGTNAALYQVNGSTIESKSAIVYDTTAGATNSHSFDVTYTSGANVYKDTVILNITQSTNAVVKSAVTTLTAAEGTAMSFKSVESSPGSSDGVLSSNLQTFVSANTGGAANGGWSVSGTDASALSISNAGVVTITGGTDRETKANYSFNVEFKTNTGDQFVEAVTLTVSDLAEREYTIIAPHIPDTVYVGDTFTVQVDGQTVTTQAVTSNGAITLDTISGALNVANAALTTPADGIFSVAANGNDLVFIYNDAAIVQSSALTQISYNPAAAIGTAAVTTTGAINAAEVINLDIGTTGANQLAAGDTVTVSDGITAFAHTFAPETVEVFEYKFRGDQGTWSTFGDGDIIDLTVDGTALSYTFQNPARRLEINSNGSGFANVFNGSLTNFDEFKININGTDISLNLGGGAGNYNSPNQPNNPLNRMNMVARGLNFAAVTAAVGVQFHASGDPNNPTFNVTYDNIGTSHNSEIIGTLQYKRNNGAWSDIGATPVDYPGSLGPADRSDTRVNEITDIVAGLQNDPDYAAASFTISVSLQGGYGSNPAIRVTMKPGVGHYPNNWIQDKVVVTDVTGNTAATWYDPSRQGVTQVTQGVDGWAYTNQSDAIDDIVATIRGDSAYNAASYTVAKNATNDGIELTKKSFGAFDHSSASISSDDAFGNFGAGGVTTEVTAGSTATAEVVTISNPSLPTIAQGDKFSVDIGGVTVTTLGLNAGAILTDVASALTTAEGLGSNRGTFSVSGSDLLFTYGSTGVIANSSNTGLTYIPNPGTISQTAAGVDHPGLTVATQNDSTAGLATTQRTGNFAIQNSEEVIKAASTVTLIESATINLDKAALSSGFVTYVSAHGGGKYSLSGTDAASFAVDQSTGVVSNKANMDYETKSSYSFDVTYTDSSDKTFFESVTLVLTDSTVDNGLHLDDVNLETSSGAASAVTILDTALNQISASSASLGAIQNRLQHNIDNLSMSSMLTETARGRIVDADFARETSQLSKQQILSQAATSMLAQANQSKQSVLALLQ